VWIYDWSHLLKTLRNHLLAENKVLLCPTFGCSISMKDLHDFCKLHPILSQIPPESILFPSDKQDVDPVLNLISIASYLKGPSLIDADKQTCLYVYLSYMHLLYLFFTSKHSTELFNTLEKKKKILLAIQDFFCSTPILNTKWISSATRTHINVCFQSLFALEESYQLLFGVSVPEWCWFSTLVCENYFSMIRRKVRYPSIYEYLICCRRAEMELIKMTAVDCPYSIPWKRIGKKYNNQHGIGFSMDDICLLWTKEERLADRFQKSNLTYSSTDLQFCCSIAEKLPPSRNRFTNREATCKDNPLQVKNNVYVWCSFPDCSRVSPYKNLGSYRNHLLLHHQCTPSAMNYYYNLSFSQTFQFITPSNSLNNNNILEEDVDVQL
jgi:hypothetical protein